jgi:hypothetical protein
MRVSAVVHLLGIWVLHGAGNLDWSPQITIRVSNADAIPSGTRLQGEMLASRILARAGISVRWVECPSGDERPLRTEYRMHLLGGEPPPALGVATGFSVLYPVNGRTDGYAGIFYPRVKQVAERESTPESLVLGAALAHEIGHLLLGPKSHGAAGVMLPRLGHWELVQAARGELQFSAGEALAMAAELKRRSF